MDNSFHQIPNSLGSKKSIFSKKRLLLIAIGVLVLFLSLPFVTFASVPGDFLYGLKRFGEGFDSTILVAPDLSATMQGYFSQRRIDEAIALSTTLNKQTTNQQAQTTTTIRSLLDEYITIADRQLPIFTSQIEKNQFPPTWATDYFQKLALHEYIELEKLRLSAPADAQGKVLHAEAVTQESLALLADSQQTAPVSVSDVREFTPFVTTGFISQSEMETILSAKSNRELYRIVSQKVQEGTLPATALPALIYDQIQTYFPQEYAAFRSNIEFNELRKIILLTIVAEPTALQRQQIQQYLQNYSIGKLLPTSDIRPYVAPLIYGISLSTETDSILKNINPTVLTPNRKEIYTIWQHVNKEGLTTKEAFIQLFELSNAQIGHNADLLELIQLDSLDALKENVVYLAFPPGWTQDMVQQVRDAFSIRISLLKKTEEDGLLNQGLNTNLTQALSPLASPSANATLETARLSFLARIFSFEQNLIETASTTQYTQQRVDQQIDALHKTFLAALSTLKNANNSTEIGNLEKSVNQSIDSLHAANAQINNQQAIRQSYLTSIQAQVSGITNMQDQYITQLGSLLFITTPTTGTQTSYNNIRTLAAKNNASLQAAFATFSTSYTQLQKQFALSAIASYLQVQRFQQETAKLPSTSTDVKQQMQKNISTMQLAIDTAQRDLTNIALTFDTRFQLFLQLLTDSNTLQLQQAALSPLAGQNPAEMLSFSVSQQSVVASNISAQTQDLQTFQSSLTSLGGSQPTQITIPTNPTTLPSLATSFTQSQQTLQQQIDILNSEWSSLPTGFSFNITDFDKTKKALDDHFAKLADQLDAQFRQYQEQLNADLQRLRNTTNQEIVRIEQKAKDLQKDLENKTPIQVETLQPTSTPINTPTSSPVNSPTPTPTSAPIPTPTPTPPGNSGGAPGHNK